GHGRPSRRRAPDGRESRTRLQPRDGPLTRAGECGRDAARDPRVLQPVLGRRASAGGVRGRRARRARHVLGRDARRHHARRRRAGRTQARSERRTALRPPPLSRGGVVEAQRTVPGAHVTGLGRSGPRTGAGPGGPWHAPRAWAIAALGLAAVAAAPWVIGEGTQRFL